MQTVDSASVALYLQLFKGREDYFAEQGEDWYFPIPKAFDSFYLGQHLAGDATYGLYLLDGKSCCHVLCVDIDIPKGEIDEVDIVDRNTKFNYLRPKLEAAFEALHTNLSIPKESILLEDTGGRGYHLWIFLAFPLEGRVAVNFGAVLKKHLTFEVEFFPKQPTLNERRKFGNLIKLPLGFHKKYRSRSVFFTLAEDGLAVLDGIEANLEHLRTLVPISPEVIVRSVQTFGAAPLLSDQAPRTPIDSDARVQYTGDPKQLITSCHALQNIRSKAEAGQALTRSEAFHFANVLLSAPGGADIVHEAVSLSFGQKYDHRRTQQEIDKILPLHPTSCSTLVQLSICPA